MFVVCLLQTVTSYSPTTNEPIALVKQASPADYDKVVQASTEAYKHWCDVSRSFLYRLKLYYLLR